MTRKLKWIQFISYFTPWEEYMHVYRIEEDDDDDQIIFI